MLVSAKEMLNKAFGNGKSLFILNASESKSRSLCSRTVQHQQPGVDKSNPDSSRGM